jgi:hypothetical protein
MVDRRPIRGNERSAARATPRLPAAFRRGRGASVTTDVPGVVR